MPHPRTTVAGLAVALLVCLALAGCKTTGASPKTDPRVMPDTRTTSTVLSKEHVEAVGDASERWNITLDIDGSAQAFNAQNLYGAYVVGQKVDLTYFTHRSGAYTIKDLRPHVSGPGQPAHSFARVAVDESFVDDRYHWKESDTDTLLVRREPGGVRIAARGAEARVRKTGMDFDAGADFRVEMDVTLTSGPVEGFSRHFGLLWGMGDNDYAGLFVTDTGRFLFGGFDHGQWSGMTRWWNIQGVRLGERNTLAVTRLDGLFILEVNGQRLAEMPVREPGGDGLGFFVSKDAEALVSRISVLTDAPGMGAAPGPAAGPAPSGDAGAKAAQLRKLRDAGLITAEEFDVKMRELAPPAPAAPADPKAALKAKMDDLERLRQAGLISDEEYEAKRAALIDTYLGQ